MEQYGNAKTFNIDSVIVQNIKGSLYYAKNALDLDTPYELIDEIFEKVDHVEPWLSGNARGPSTAFCLLFRLGQLRPEPSVIRDMLDHRDSPFIRAVGFLYLRYCCNPRELWKWFKKYVHDEEEFTPSPGVLGKRITIGQFARDILLDQFYFETIFPRIPKAVSDDIRNSLKSMELPAEPVGNAGQGGQSRRGAEGGSRRPASVKSSLSVALGQRAPNRSGVREEGRGLGAEIHLDRQERRSHYHRKRSRSPSKHRERSFPTKDKFASYDRYDRYDRYEKYDRYDRYEKYDKYDDQLKAERPHGQFSRGDFRRGSHRRIEGDQYGDRCYGRESNRFSGEARHEQRSRAAETESPRRDARDVFKERPASFRGHISGY